jgi:hypothetical protein
MNYEMWLPVEGYESQYQVSSTGRVRALDRFVPNRWGTLRPIKGRILKQGKTRQGYHYVLFSKDGKSKKFFIHRLVAAAFIENPDYLPQVNHLDGKKSNNRADNLEWTTCQQNCHHAVKNKLYETARGINQGHAVLTDDIVRDIRKQAASGIWHKVLAAQYGVGRKAITKIVNNQRWKHVI